jgi:hypothetical protein
MDASGIRSANDGLGATAVAATAGEVAGTSIAIAARLFALGNRARANST